MEGINSSSAGGTGEEAESNVVHDMKSAPIFSSTEDQNIEQEEEPQNQRRSVADSMVVHKKRSKEANINAGQTIAQQHSESTSDQKAGGDGSEPQSALSPGQSQNGDQPTRYDRNGVPITTFVGKFLLNSQRKKSTNQRSASSSDTGGPVSPSKTEKQGRHKLTFMDEVTNDPEKLVELHKIESYKKYNQEIFLEHQVQGCCTIF